VTDLKTNVAAAFGTALREARQKASISQEALALSCGIDRTFVSMLERGVRQPTISTILSLAVVLEVSPESLVARTNALLKGLQTSEKRRRA
jgi:transcriptional regulator with XRE-family HTH domain